MARIEQRSLTLAGCSKIRIALLGNISCHRLPVVNGPRRPAMRKWFTATPDSPRLKAIISLCRMYGPRASLSDSTVNILGVDLRLFGIVRWRMGCSEADQVRSVAAYRTVSGRANLAVTVSRCITILKLGHDGIIDPVLLVDGKIRRHSE